MLRPPPRRRASTSVAMKALPKTVTASTKTHLRMTQSSRPCMLSKTVPAMDRDHAGGEVKHFDVGKANGAQHFRECGLVGMLPDRVRQVAIGVGVPGDLVA